MLFFPISPRVGCTPGEGGIPDSFIGDLLCGHYDTDTPSLLLRWAVQHRLALVTILTICVLVRVGWAVWRRHAWRAHAARARWLEIVPPVTATPAATVHLWRLLATLLAAPHRLAVHPARLVWEVQADPSGMRCGIWIPPGINPTAVIRVVQRAWPGARITQADPPDVARRMPHAGLSLVFARPEWQQLLDDSTTSRADGNPADDRLRAVYDGLAAAGRTGGGQLQVIVGRAPRHRVAALRRATVNPARARRTRGSLRVVAMLAEMLRVGILAVLDLVTPGPSTPKGAQATDPYLAESARQARAKYAAAPHLLVAVYAVAAGPSAAAARAAAADITSGYALLGGHLSRRRLRRVRTAARSRYASETRMTLATVAEVAAFAGLPAEPVTFGLPAAASRHRLPGRDTWRPDDRPKPAAPGGPMFTIEESDSR